jgi:hypothetical protein
MYFHNLKTRLNILFVADLKSEITFVFLLHEVQEERSQYDGRQLGLVLQYPNLLENRLTPTVPGDAELELSGMRQLYSGTEF